VLTLLAVQGFMKIFKTVKQADCYLFTNVWIIEFLFEEKIWDTF